MVALKIVVASFIIYVTTKVSKYLEENIITELHSTRLDILVGTSMIIIDVCAIYIVFELINYIIKIF